MTLGRARFPVAGLKEMGQGTSYNDGNLYASFKPTKTLLGPDSRLSLYPLSRAKQRRRNMESGK